MHKIDIIIVAAGSGLRYGTPLPKQFCELKGKPVVMHTIEAFRRLLPEASITLVINSDMEVLWQNLCQRHSFASPATVYGGASRWESVRHAVTALPENEDGIIMVHDAVRPLIDKGIISRICEAMDSDPQADGVIPVTAVTDSLRRYDNNGGSRSIDRNRFVAVQTPQAFRSHLLHAAYQLPYEQSFTDDASVMEAAGFGNLRLVEGSTYNIKITNPGDIAYVSMLMDNASR